MKIEIRREQPGDYECVRNVNDEAFKQETEGKIVDRVRESDPDHLSLVAIDDRQIIGHIFFSRVIIESKEDIVNGMGLAPMAVLPSYQNQGIGSMLVKRGIKILKENAIPFIIVLGHEHYYPRFGFTIASCHGIRCQWERVPDKAFLIMILDDRIMQNVKGIARYRKEFDEAI